MAVEDQNSEILRAVVHMKSFPLALYILFQEISDYRDIIISVWMLGKAIHGSYVNTAQLVGGCNDRPVFAVETRIFFHQV